MKNNSTKIIKILIIIFVVIVLIVGCLFVFLATDLFRSNKILFTKYASQLFSEKNSFIDNSVLDYYIKIMETPFENETTLSFNSEQNGQELVNQVNITANGKADVKNKIVEESIRINYSPEVIFPINLRYKGGLFGYQTDYVGGKYLVDDRNQTISSDVVSEDSNQTEQTITEEDINNIISKYSEIAFAQLSEDKFSKENDGNTNIYKLNLTTTDIVNIINSVFEALKQDQETMDKLNIDSNEIDSFSSQIQNNLQDEETNIDIFLYKNGGKITKLEVKWGETTISLEKTTQDESLQYKAILSIASSDTQIVNIEANFSYRGLSTLQSIEDNCLFNINMVDNGTTTNLITYNINNKVNFVDSINVESFDDNNAVIYSRYDKVQIESFAQAVNERIQQVNQTQMEQLGVSESQNPIIQAIMIPFSGLLIQSSSFDTINNASLQSQQDLTQQVDVNSFNQKFELYQGTNIQGTTVRGLLTTISNNNGLQENTNTQQSDNFNILGDDSSNYKIEEINFNGEEYEVNGQNIAALKEEVVPENYYRVEFEKKPDTGLIYRAVINQK